MKKFLIILMSLTFSLSVFAQSSPQKEWEKLSQDEKWLCLLSEPFLSFYDVSRTTVNPEPQGETVHAVEVLEKGWDLHSKNDVLALLEKYRNGNWGGRDWWLEKADDLLKKYPEASIDEIAKAENLEIWQVVTLCFYAENKDLLGTHGVLALDIVRLLGIIRWSVGTGWFTEAEAVNEARPLMTQLLNAYDSLEDLSAHFAFSWYLYAYANGYYVSAYQGRIDSAVKNYAKPSESANQFINHNIKFL